MGRIEPEMRLNQDKYTEHNEGTINLALPLTLTDIFYYYATFFHRTTYIYTQCRL